MLRSPERSGANPWSRSDDDYLVAMAKQGSAAAYDQLVRRYHGLVRLKASSYFLIGGDTEDLVQEGLLGLYKAVRDYRSDRESSFKSFADLCVSRQIITAVKTATRHKHIPLNSYMSFSQSPATATAHTAEEEPTLEEVLQGPDALEPSNSVICAEEFRSLVRCLTSELSPLEGEVTSLYLDGHSYDAIAESVGCEAKTVDNALQRVKRKVGVHLRSRELPVPAG